MEASEEVTPTPEPEETAPEEDPFADVEADPLAGAEELPPGVEQGSLGGTDLNPEAEVEEPVEEGEPLPPAEAVPADEEPVEQPEEPAAEVEPSPDPEDEEQPEVPAEEESIVPETSPPETAPELETEVEGTGPKEETSSESPSPEPSPEPEPEKPKRAPRRRSGKKRSSTNGKDDREYVVLKETAPGAWEEAFPRETKGEGLRTGKKHEPTTIVARNGEVALRRAYRLLTGDEEPANFILVATPKPYFRPKPVNGRVLKQTAISIGG